VYVENYRLWCVQSTVYPFCHTSAYFLSLPFTLFYVSQLITYSALLINRVPLCMSPRRNWDSRTPSPASDCAPPPPPSPEPRGTHACGWGGGGVPIPTKACDVHPLGGQPMCQQPQLTAFLNHSSMHAAIVHLLSGISFKLPYFSIYYGEAGFEPSTEVFCSGSNNISSIYVKILLALRI
jgi:hypothetical protein